MKINPALSAIIFFPPPRMDRGEKKEIQGEKNVTLCADEDMSERRVVSLAFPRNDIIHLLGLIMSSGQSHHFEPSNFYTDAGGGHISFTLFLLLFLRSTKQRIL